MYYFFVLFRSVRNYLDRYLSLFPQALPSRPSEIQNCCELLLFQHTTSVIHCLVKIVMFNEHKLNSNC